MSERTPSAPFLAMSIASQFISLALKAAAVSVRYQVGEGLEKRVDDFASEVMSQVN